MSATIFVLLAVSIDSDVPPELWVFANQAAAENFLRGWSEDFLGGYSHDVTNLPPDAELVAAFRNMGAHVHLYCCDLDGGGSEELVLFEHAGVQGEQRSEFISTVHEAEAGS